MARLTKLDKEMLSRSAQFALAGEWPWEEADTPKNNRRYEREHAALISGAMKLCTSPAIASRAAEVGK